MGFDPRSPGRQPFRGVAARGVVTSNVDTLLEENDALRREVRRLRQQLQALQMERTQPERVSCGGRHGITVVEVERWGIAMARHPRWPELRIGPPGGLRGLVEQRRRTSWNPGLSLEEELERLAPGLGAELQEALRGPHSRVRWAVRAAFALHGQRAPEWLSDAPLRLVDDLLRLVPGPRRRRGTRTENHSHSHSHSQSQSQRKSQGQSKGHTHAAGEASDSRGAALRLLGLEPGASVAAIRRAYRRLAKAHHPDLGGSAAAFHRLDAAYRLLIGSELQG